MEGGGNGEAFLRQLSVGGEGRVSRRWGRGKSSNGDGGVRRVEEGKGGVEVKKRVMVVIEGSARAKHAMMWALTHVANKGDILTLLHVLPPNRDGGAEETTQLANSLGALCKACKPEVEVEALVIQGPKLATVLSQVRKLEASVLVLSQGKPSPLCCLFKSSSEEFVEQCINKADCLTLAVRKQSKGVGGYLVSTRWQKNFWLLA